jgi:transcriptional regulator with XRE-family HTH domain
MKTILPYRTTTTLTKWLREEQRKRIAYANEEILMKDIEQELADYCGITINGIRRIKRDLCSPSIEVGFKIAEFFNVKVSDIFELIEKEEYMVDKENKQFQAELIE